MIGTKWFGVVVSVTLLLSACSTVEPKSPQPEETTKSGDAVPSESEKPTEPNKGIAESHVAEPEVSPNETVVETDEKIPITVKAEMTPAAATGVIDFKPFSVADATLKDVLLFETDDMYIEATGSFYTDDAFLILPLVIVNSSPYERMVSAYSVRVNGKYVMVSDFFARIIGKGAIDTVLRLPLSEFHTLGIDGIQEIRADLHITYYKRSMPSIYQDMIVQTNYEPSDMQDVMAKASAHTLIDDDIVLMKINKTHNDKFINNAPRASTIELLIENRENRRVMVHCAVVSIDNIYLEKPFTCTLDAGQIAIQKVDISQVYEKKATGTTEIMFGVEVYTPGKEEMLLISTSKITEE